MQAVKRVEIVIPEVFLREALELLARHDVRGFTAQRGLSGRGERGLQAGDGLSGEFANAAILVACEPKVFEALAEDLRALLKGSGGLCLVSDALSLKH